MYISSGPFLTDAGKPWFDSEPLNEVYFRGASLHGHVINFVNEDLNRKGRWVLPSSFACPFFSHF
jgi:hypothetical protein